MNYFLEARWSHEQGRHNIKFSEIRLSSQYILAGERTSATAYIPPFGNAAFTTIDVDKSDETQEHLTFADEPGGLKCTRRGIMCSSPMAMWPVSRRLTFPR